MIPILQDTDYARQRFFTAKIPSREEGTETHYYDCTRSFDHRGHSRPMMSATDVIEKTFFERLYLVLGLRKIAPWVKCPYALTTPIDQCIPISRFSCNFFPWMAPHFFGHHDSPSNLAKYGTLGTSLFGGFWGCNNFGKTHIPLDSQYLSKKISIPSQPPADWDVAMFNIVATL